MSRATGQRRARRRHAEGRRPLAAHPRRVPALLLEPPPASVIVTEAKHGRELNAAMRAALARPEPRPITHVRIAAGSRVTRKVSGPLTVLAAPTAAPIVIGGRDVAGFTAQWAGRLADPPAPLEGSVGAAIGARYLT